MFACIFVLIAVNYGQSDDERSSKENVFRVGPNYSGGQFLGLLPKRKTPVPSSGPSRKHNDIGPEAYHTSTQLP